MLTNPFKKKAVEIKPTLAQKLIETQNVLDNLKGVARIQLEALEKIEDEETARHEIAQANRYKQIETIKARIASKQEKYIEECTTSQTLRGDLSIICD